MNFDLNIIITYIFTLSYTYATEAPDSKKHLEFPIVQRTVAAARARDSLTGLLSLSRENIAKLISLDSRKMKRSITNSAHNPRQLREETN